MKGEEFLEVGKALLRMKSEAAQRSAISRAYYALFNEATQLLQAWGMTVSQNPSGHAEVQNRFFNCGVMSGADFGRDLKELRSKRIQADYNMAAKDFQNQNYCALLVAKAESAMKTVSTFKQESLRQQIQTGIREYERKIKHS